MVTIYIAEDNPILLQGLERALRANGYEVDTAADGRAMIDLLREGPLPDLLLLDVMMPGMTGLEVLEKIRSDDRTAHLPVMLITAATEEILPPPDRMPRDVELLTKPFRLADLLSRIDTQIRSSRQQRSGTEPIRAVAS
jgi:DNA-binding response OmpR family regulator